MRDIRILFSSMLVASLCMALPGEASSSSSSSSDSSSSSNECKKKGGRGIAGPRGHRGRTGDTGDRGPRGAQGAQGDQGNQGAVGPQGNPEGTVFTPICANGALNIFGTIPFVAGAGVGDGYTFAVADGALTITPTDCGEDGYVVVATATDAFGNKTPINVTTGAGCVFTLTPPDGSGIQAISFIAFACNTPPGQGESNAQD